MAKYCKGCGILLQDSDSSALGYTPDIKKELCQRCFRLKNYGENKALGKKVNNEDILAKINKKKIFTIFLSDFFSINNEVINMYQKITNPKILVITKSDLIPKNLDLAKLGEKIKKIYNLEEDINFISSKNKTYSSIIANKIKQENQIILAGFTNAGKSSLINNLANTDLTISKNANTTLDFIKVKTDNGLIYDSPGFELKHYVEGVIPLKQVRPISYQLKNKYLLLFNDFKLASSVDNNLVCFFSNEVKIEKRRKDTKLITTIKILPNTDLIIKGLGFILIKKECLLSLDITDDLIEVRPSIVGGIHEQD